MPEFPFIGGSYQGRSKNINAQRCVNLFGMPDPGGKVPIALHGTPGLTTWLDTAAPPVRGLWVFGDYLYAVCGNILYEITSAAVKTSKGTLNTSYGYAYMEDNRDQLMVCDGVTGYILEADDTWGAIADADFPGASSLTYQDGYFIVSKPSSDRFYISDLLNGLSWNALSYKTCSSKTDKLMRVISHQKALFAIGERSTEIFYNSGDADFPFDAVPGGIVEIGTPAASSPATAKTGELFVFCDDFLVRKVVGYDPIIVTPPQIAYQFQSYSMVSDAIGYCFHMEGQTFYVLTFPHVRHTWLYNATTDYWSEWHSAGYERHRSNCYAYFAGKHLVGDFLTGKIHEMDMDVYDEDGDEIIAYRTCQSLANDRKNVRFKSLEIEFEPGVGLYTGQGSDPQAMLSWSDDGGHTFGNEIWTDIGAIGKRGTRARWNKLGIARDRIFKVAISDPVKRVIIGAHLEAETLKS